MTLLLPWCTALVLIPFVAAVVLSRLADRRLARRVAMISGVLCLLIGGGLLLTVNAAAGERPFLADPLAASGALPILNLDLINAPLIVLTGLVTLASLWGTSAPEARIGTMARTLALQSSIHLALLSARAEVFVLAWVLSLLPAIWELRDRGSHKLAWVFAGYQGLGALALAGSLLAYGGGVAIFEGNQAGTTLEIGLIVCLVVAALVRQGIFPFHSWLPALSEQTPPGLVALTVLPQLGGYLLLRVLVASPSASSASVLQAVFAIAAVSAVYGALLGVVQRDLRRGVGWLVASQSGLVVCGLVAENAVGLSGGLLLCISSGLALAGLLLVVSAVETRFGQVNISQPRGLGGRVPALGAFFLLLGFASVGLPGSLGFVAEDLLFHGALELSPGVGLALVLATAINGFSVLRLYYRAFQGGRPRLPRVEDALPRERLVLLSLVLVLLVAGLWPGHLVTASAREASQVHSVHAGD